MKTIEQIWNDGKRLHVVECLVRDELPYRGWDKDFPDLAEQRLRQVQADGCIDCGRPIVANFRCEQCS